ncbi:transcription elongation factor [Microthyrium microscopicum]|uniref:Transcription elongation factor n=1 Tax=Microthyrium microscopicum TaxID=703497 RepID=A0A6A6USZ1_9PEZI|nr:transcription elongation factor [Microthyrium microscopicum]
MALTNREVEQKGRDLAKASTATDANERITSLLADLRKGVVASEELLRSTKIGIVVNKFKSHSDKAIARQAQELVGKWRVDVRGRTASGPQSGTASGASTPRPGGLGVGAHLNGSVSPAARMSSPAAGVVVAKGKSKSSAPKEKRNAKEDGVKWQLTDNATRDSCLKLMYDGLAFMSEEDSSDILRVAKHVEEAAYKTYKPETSDPYKNKMRSLFQNLKNKSNQALRERVLSGDITPLRFVNMTHEELKSAERQAEDARLMKENMDKAMVAEEEKSISVHLTCGKCGQKKVSYTQAQTRSADEPMTTFCECMNCGNRWKFS